MQLSVALQQALLDGFDQQVVVARRAVFAQVHSLQGSHGAQRVQALGGWRDVVQPAVAIAYGDRRRQAGPGGAQVFDGQAATQRVERYTKGFCQFPVIEVAWATPRQVLQAVGQRGLTQTATLGRTQWLQAGQCLDQAGALPLPEQLRGGYLYPVTGQPCGACQQVGPAQPRPPLLADRLGLRPTGHGPGRGPDRGRPTQADRACCGQAHPGLADPDDGAYLVVMEQPQCIATQARHVWIHRRQHGTGGEHCIDCATPAVEHLQARRGCQGVRGAQHATAGMGDQGLVHC
ncbi:hypothetical protein D3C81_1336080 [compost metagenome]